MVQDEHFLYVGDGELGAARLSKACEPSAHLGPFDGSYVTALAVDDQRVYWSHLGLWSSGDASGVDELRAVRKDGSGYVRFAKERSNSLAVDDNAVYWFRELVGIVRLDKSCIVDGSDGGVPTLTGRECATPVDMTPPPGDLAADLTAPPVLDLYRLKGLSPCAHVAGP